MKDFARLARLFRPHARAALVAVLAMIGVALFTTLVAYLFGPLFDQVLSPGQGAAVKQELAADPAARGLGKALARDRGGEEVDRHPLARRRAPERPERGRSDGGEQGRRPAPAPPRGCSS